MYERAHLFMSNMEKMFPAEYETRCTRCTFTKKLNSLLI